MRRAVKAILTAAIGAGPLPATTATNAFAASRASAPPGAQSAAIAACPSGTRPFSGGTLSTADTVDVQLATVTSYAICAA